MDNLTTYKTWAPDNTLWTEWAKPVLFASNKTNPLDTMELVLNIPKINWLFSFQKNTALVVDLPGETGVEESLALASLGYRPVPLYNGVYGNRSSTMAVDVRILAWALFAGAELLASINLQNNAPPVFMLDSRRMNVVGNMSGIYDNRWCVFPQDMPSASFLMKQGINNIVVRTDKETSPEKIKNDLTHILCRYQEAGINIQHTYGDNEAENMTVSKPSQFRNMLYRFRILTGLSRNPAGGFGCLIPEVNSHHHVG